MKKFLSLIIAVIFSINLNAQVSDFTATDYFGNEIHLYEILEDGQYVLLHLNTRTNDATPKITPPLVEAYKNLGCNQHDVFFIGVVPNAAHSTAKKYVEEYGIEFPMIHNADDSDPTEGIAMEIWRSYNCDMPTTILIAPDKSIAIADIASIDSAEDIITALAAFGIQEYECGGDDTENTEGEEQNQVIEIKIDEVTTTKVKATFTPVGECASYYILCGIEAEMEQWVAWLNKPLEQLIEEWSRANDGTDVISNIWDELVPNTEYTLYALSKDAEGNVIKLDTKKVSTGVLGGEGVSVIDVQVEVLSNTSAYLVVTPNEETAEYHYILIEQAYADSIGIDSTMKILHEDPYTLYEIDRWEWIDLRPETEYFAIAQGKNVKGEWGEITKIEFVTTIEGTIELIENSFNIYPNPASSEVRISSTINGEANVSIYDMTGRCVKEIRVSDISNATINLNDVDKGVYVINVNGNVEKLIIK